jgi:hypothetical protein
MTIARIKRKDKQNKRINSKFMNMSTRKKRYVPLFMDQYTQKDDEQQKQILKLNDQLDHKYIDKQKLEKKIDDFLSDMERRTLFEKLYNEEIKVAEHKNEFLEKVKKKVKEETMDEIYHQLNDYNKEDAHVKIKTDIIDDELNNADKREENYQMFKEFRNRVFDNASKELVKNQVNLVNSIIKSSTNIRKIDFNKFLNQSPKDIIMTLRRHSLERKVTLNNLSKLKTHGFKNSNFLLIRFTYYR